MSAHPSLSSVDAVTTALADHDYLADRGLATTIFLATSLNRPLLLEGEAGVGKTEVAKVLAAMTGGELIRLQCYEGIDANQALYEWNYTAQPRPPPWRRKRACRSRCAWPERTRPVHCRSRAPRVRP